MSESATPVEPITGVVVDYHMTLVHGGDPAAWVADAWARLGRDGIPQQRLGERYAALLAFLDVVWVHAAGIDPDSTRDLSPVAHREVFLRTAAAGRAGPVGPGLDPQLAEALHATMLDQWTAYDDAAPTLRELRARGIRVAILSNIGVALDGVLARQGLAPHVDAVVESWRTGIVKPHPGAFAAALDALGMPAGRVLMVGDSARDDAGAAALGIRTLILPRTTGPVHGLEIVLRLVG